MLQRSAKVAASTPRRPERRPQRPPKVSVPAAPSIQAESLYQIASELTPLFVRFWKESGRDDVPLDPDWAALLRLTASGQLRVVTVRQDEVLVGFILNVVGGHLMHRGTVHGTTNAYWLDPLYRTGWFPVKLFRRNLELLREWGCKRVFIAADLSFQDGRVGKIFERLGYRRDEVSYEQLL